MTCYASSSFSNTNEEKLNRSQKSQDEVFIILLSTSKISSTEYETDQGNRPKIKL